MIYGTWGIFRGGEVSAGANSLAVNPAILRSSDGRNFGLGSGREILVRFGQEVDPFEYQILRPSDWEPPIYDLAVGADAGRAYLVFDPDIGADVSFVSQPTNTQIVLKTVEWDAAAAEIADLRLLDGDRRITRRIETEDPLGTGGLYHPGMDFGDVAFNGPLVAMKLLSEAYQAELKVRHGNHYDIVLLGRDELAIDGNELTIPPFEIVRRIHDEAQGDYFAVLMTREPYAFTYDLPTLTGQRIRILVNPTTGVVSSSTDPEAPGIVATFTDVRPGDTLDTLVWVWSRAQQTQLTLSLTKLGEGEDLSAQAVASAPWPAPFTETPDSYLIARLDDGQIPTDLVTVGLSGVGVRASVSKGALRSALGAAYTGAPLGRTWYSTFLITASSLVGSQNPLADGSFYADGSISAGG